MGKAARSTAVAAMAATAALGAGMSGCALSPSATIASVTPVQTTKAGRARPATRMQDVDIRTKIKRAGVEISGAACEAASRDVSVRFKSPARLRLPLYGEDTAPLLVTCEHPVQGRATRSISPSEKSEGGVLSLLSGGLFGDGEAKGDALSYAREYELELVKGAAPAAAPPKPSDVSSRPLPPIQGAPTAPETKTR